MTPADGFAGWLRAQRHRDDPVGDLARDFVDDRRQGCLGRAVRTARGLRSHICHRHDQVDTTLALAALERAHAEFAA
jgi:hypothetical protein